MCLQSSPEKLAGKKSPRGRMTLLKIMCRSGKHVMTRENTYTYRGTNRTFTQCRACTLVARQARAQRRFQEAMKEINGDKD
jgi:hypothetical protein